MTDSTAHIIFSFISKSHIFFSVMAVLFFILSLIFVKNKIHHKRFALFYNGALICSVSLGIILAMMGLLSGDFILLGNNQSARFLKNFNSREITDFGYIIPIQRALIIFMMTVHIFKLQRIIEHATSAKNLMFFLIGVFAFTFYFYTPVMKPIFWPYHLNTIIILISVGLVAQYSRMLSNQHQHATWSMLTFLIFLETGVLGGASNYVPFLQTRDVGSFILLRLIPLALTLVFSRILLTKKHK